MGKQVTKARAARELAEKMLRVLEAQRRLGGSAYPLSIKRLAELTDAHASDAVVGKAVRMRSVFEARTLATKIRNTDAVVAFAEDIDRLADSTLVLDWAFDQCETKTKALFTVAQLKIKLTKSLQQQFEKAIGRRITEQTLPSHIGWVYAGRNPSLIRLQSLHPDSWRQRLRIDNNTQRTPTASTEPTSSVAKPVLDRFADLFDLAFERIDREKGSHNFVSLLDLRRELSSYSREQFDSELRQLRIDGRYSLSAGESRQAISSEQRDAGIHESGSLLLHVSRRTS